MNYRMLLASLICLLIPTTLFAGSPPIDIVAPSHSHLVWIMVCAVLVIFMTIPGIAIFYGGLVHHSNVLSIYTQCLAMAAITSVAWLIFGFSLSFGYGDLKTHMMIGDWSLFSSNLDMMHAHTNRQLGTMVDLFYQMGFAMITVVIVIGGFAERMKLSAALIFAPIWLLIVYCPIAHWIWGGGWLAKLGVMDFAGGAVVHMNAGIAGLVAAIMIGRRQNKSKMHYSLSIVTIGTSILWVGWFGFNGGSAHHINTTAIALINTQLAPSAAGLSWLFTEHLHTKKPSARGLLFGVISGLVVITPMAGYCSLFTAIIVGLLVSPVCYFAIQLKEYIGYDDALDAFGIHGVAGILGALLTGLVVSPSLGGAGWDTGSLLGQLGAQVTAVSAVLIWSGCCTFVILWVINKLIGLRVPENVELSGLDLHIHGEEVAPQYYSSKSKHNDSNTH